MNKAGEEKDTTKDDLSFLILKFCTRYQYRVRSAMYVEYSNVLLQVEHCAPVLHNLCFREVSKLPQVLST